MESLLSERSLPVVFDHKTAINRLTDGRDLTKKLQFLLQKPLFVGSCEPAKDLADKIVLSIEEAISTLTSGRSHDGSLNLGATRCRLSPSSEQEVKDSCYRRKTPATKDGKDHRRSGVGCKRRRTSAATRSTVSASPFDDGYVWRKYGQKAILGAKYPRAYYRCTHKHDQGCQATKQVQKSETNPSMYAVTYMGQHTCKVASSTPQLILDTGSGDLSILNLESTVTMKNDQYPIISSSVNNEFKQSSSTQSDYMPLFDHMMISSNSPTMVPDTGDVTSSCAYSSNSSHNLDMMDTTIFDVIQFDGEELVFKTGSTSYC